MEPISEERQRAIYEFVYSELKGKDWYIKGGTQALCYDEEGSLVCPIDDYLQPLYIKHNGEMVPNVQFFIDECVPQLEVEGLRVSWGSKTSMHEGRFLLSMKYQFRWFVDTDPYAAVSEYLEAK